MSDKFRGRSMMDFLVSAADRAAFKRCRRQWDFCASTRRRLRPARSPGPDLGRAIRDALAVYYFPGMWDWDSAVVLPLVSKGLDKSIAQQRAQHESGAPGTADDADWDRLHEDAHALLDRYIEWAPAVDQFSPVRVSTDFDALVTDPDDAERGLATPDGQAIHYTGRIDLMAIDEHDRYWIVRHRVSAEPFPDTEQLMLDEEEVSACWGWSRFYDGMEMTGTIYNELATVVPESVAPQSRSPRPLADHPRGGIRQNEPSGGGRGVSSLRRMYVKGREEESYERVRQMSGPGFRRTIIRRGRDEVSDAGRRIAEEAMEMVRPGLSTYPNPSPEHCTSCAFLPPCLALNRGRDAESILAQDYRRRPAVELEPGRLGGTPHGVGRGWVLPPRGDG